MEAVVCERTQYGFRFGAARFECTIELPDGRVVVTVTTDTGRKLDIYVSRTGRSLRVFGDHKEWKP